MTVMRHVKGMDKLLKEMKRQGEKTAKRFEKGMKKAGLFLQRESQKIVPIDTGVLRSSAFTRAEGKGFSVIVWVGYTAYYAIYVHEDLNAQHAEGKQAKYLESPAREKRKEMIQLIRDEVTQPRDSGGRFKAFQ